MEISNLGDGVVRLSNRQLTLLIGPTIPAGVKADVVAVTQQASGNAGDAMLIDGPGEYEVKGVLINGIAAQLHVDKEGLHGTIYAVRSDDIVITVLANIAPGLSNEQLEAMGQVDVLIVPVGGKGLTLDAEAAAQVTSQVEPHVVIPVHYDDGKSKYAMPQDGVEPFLKELGAQPETVSKYKITTRDLPEETAVVVLKPESK